MALLGVQIRWMGVGAGVGRVLVLVLVLVPPLWCCLLVGTHLELQALLHFVHVDGDTDEKYLGNVVSAAAVVVAVVAAVAVGVGVGVGGGGGFAVAVGVGVGGGDVMHHRGCL